MSIQSSFAPSPFVEPVAARPRADAPEAEREAERFALPEETPSAPPSRRTETSRPAAEAAPAASGKGERPSDTAPPPTAAPASPVAEEDASATAPTIAPQPGADALFALAVAAQTGEETSPSEDGVEAPAEAGEATAVAPSIELQPAASVASLPAVLGIDLATPTVAATVTNPTTALVAAAIPDAADAVAAQGIATTVAAAPGAVASDSFAASATASVSGPALTTEQPSRGAQPLSPPAVAGQEPVPADAAAPELPEAAIGEKPAARPGGQENPLAAATTEAAKPDAAGVKLADALQAAIGPIDLSAAPPVTIGKAEAALTGTSSEPVAGPGVAAQGQGANAGPATPVHVVPIEIGLRILSGARKFDIRLDPAELGRVDVNLEISDKGEVTARLVVDRVETLHLLQRDARTLERAFEQAGLKPSDAGVDITLRDPADQSGFRQNREQDETPRRARANDDGGEDAALHTQPAPVRRLVRLGGVDLSI